MSVRLSFVWIAFAIAGHLKFGFEVTASTVSSGGEPRCTHGTWNNGECTCDQGYKTEHKAEDTLGALHPVYCNTTAHFVLYHYQWTGTDVLQLVSTALTVILATASALGLFHFLIHTVSLFFISRKLKVVQEKENALLIDIEKYRRDMDLVPTIWHPSEPCRVFNSVDGTEETGKDVHGTAQVRAPSNTVCVDHDVPSTPNTGKIIDIYDEIRSEADNKDPATPDETPTTDVNLLTVIESDTEDLIELNRSDDVQLQTRKTGSGDHSYVNNQPPTSDSSSIFEDSRLCKRHEAERNYPGTGEPGEVCDTGCLISPKERNKTSKKDRKNKMDKEEKVSSKKRRKRKENEEDPERQIPRSSSKRRRTRNEKNDDSERQALKKRKSDRHEDNPALTSALSLTPLGSWSADTSS